MDPLELANPEFYSVFPHTAAQAAIEIAQYAARADRTELPGLEAALRCLFRPGEGPLAADVIHEAREEVERVEREASIRNWLEVESVWRLDFDRNPGGQNTNPMFVEALGFAEASGMAMDIASIGSDRASVISVRMANADADFEDAVSMDR
jgi:hypothetical protein